MADFILLCGIPGCGKTYFGKIVEENEGFRLVSSDDIRETLWGDASDQRNPKRVFSEMAARTLDALSEGYNVIYDATNIKRKDRLSILNKVKELNPTIETYCLIFNIPVEKCLERNHARQRKVSDEVILRMAARMQIPEYDEGWDYICDLKLKEEDRNATE